MAKAATKETSSTGNPDLDLAISALVDRAGDQLAVKRLKQKKLHLKDKIARLEDELTPDIIA